MPDLSKVGVISARTEKGGYAWATATAVCPQCGEKFCITPVHNFFCVPVVVTMRKVMMMARTVVDTVSTDISDVLINQSALPILDAMGNLDIDLDPRRTLHACCPHCSHRFPVSLSPHSTVITIVILEDRVQIWEERWLIATLFRAGSACACHAPRGATPPQELYDFEELPRVLGVSEEAQRYLTWALGLGVGNPCIAHGVDLLDIALRNRFKGYGEQFVSDAIRLIESDQATSAMKSALFSLPRYTSDRKPQFDMLSRSKLPNKPSVRRAAASRIAILAAISSTEVATLCDDDPNIATLLLSSAAEDIDLISAITYSNGKVCDFIRTAATQTTPLRLVKMLQSMGSKQIAESIAAYDSMRLPRYEGWRAMRLCLKEHKLATVLKDPRILLSYTNSDQNVAIHYQKHQKALQGDFDGFRFTLPRTESRFDSAAAALRNCLSEPSYRINAALGLSTVMLVSKDNKLVAAIELTEDCHDVVQMYGKANREISPDEDLGVAITHWAMSNDVALEDFGILGGCF